MRIRELRVAGSYEITPQQWRDDRGVFLEWYRFDELESAAGRRLELAQANLSVSRRGALRGIHFADVPPGQAKHVTAVSGAVLDYVVDLRVGSPTFGMWDSVLLDDVERRAVFVSEGLGHCFVALSASATVSYMVSSTFDAEREHGLNPLDESIGLDIPIPRDELLLSPKDAAAPTLDRALADGLLPVWQATAEREAR